MNLDRFFRIVNILIGILIAAILAGAWWFFWRPLPETSGDIHVPVSAKVTVTYDSLGVPTIEAQNEEDLLFAQGYCTAQERLWQMDGLRRYSAGDLSEIVGRAALEADQESRRLRVRHMAEQDYVTMPAKDRVQLAAYARGVNAFIETHRNRLPFEFALLGYDPRPWSGVDGILVGLYMFRSLTTSWQLKLQKRDLMHGADPAKIEFLFPTRAGTEILPGSDVQPGSNAWTVSGAHSASGKPLLSNDMHLEWSIPGIWYMVHLRAPGLDVAGVSLPGVPGVIVGHNQRIAWGFTNLHFDVQDLYRETLDDRTGRYVFRGQLEQARLEREIIRVKGAPNVEQRFWVTRHGPIIQEAQGEKLALKWVAAEPGMFEFPFVELNRARNWQEFNTALSRFPGPGQNAIYADVDGNIGYQATGKLPIRRNYAGDVPVDGASGENEWEGYIPWEQLPQSFNPPSGRIVSANQNPFASNYPYRVSGWFASPDRSSQINAMLRAKDGLRPDDMLRIQKDVYSSFNDFLAHQLVKAAEHKKPSKPEMVEAISLLRNWNGQMDKDQAAPLLAALAFQYVRKAAANSASPGSGATYDTYMSIAVMRKLLRERPAGWFPDYDDMLLRALSDALDEARRMQGSYMQKWIYGKYLQLLIGHPIGHRLPLVAHYFDIGPVAMSGGITTVKQTTRRLGPSERFNADLGDWENSLLNIPTGQSEHVLSRHYKDEWDAYYTGQSFPMHYHKPEVTSTLTLLP